MKQVDEKVTDQEIELKIIKALILADQGCNHECIRELDKILAIKESSSRDSKGLGGGLSSIDN